MVSYINKIRCILWKANVQILWEGHKTWKKITSILAILNHQFGKALMTIFFSWDNQKLNSNHQMTAEIFCCYLNRKRGQAVFLSFQIERITNKTWVDIWFLVKSRSNERNIRLMLKCIVIYSILCFRDFLIEEN